MGIFLVLILGVYFYGVFYTFKESNNKFTKIVKVLLLSIFWPMFLFCGLVIAYDEYDDPIS